MVRGGRKQEGGERGERTEMKKKVEERRGNGGA